MRGGLALPFSVRKSLMSCGRPRRLEGTKTAARCDLEGCPFLGSLDSLGLADERLGGGNPHAWERTAAFEPLGFGSIFEGQREEGGNFSKIGAFRPDYLVYRSGARMA